MSDKRVDGKKAAAAVAFWDHAENARLYQEERDKNIALEKSRDEFIAHAYIALQAANKDSYSARLALEKFEEYSKLKQDL